MATATGTWTDIHDFLTELSTFATATAGWTQDKYVSGSGATPSELYLSKGTTYVSMEAYIQSGAYTYRNVASGSATRPVLEIYGNTGFNTGQAVDNQPGSSFAQTGWTTTSYWWFAGDYKFFTNATGDYIHCVIWRKYSEALGGGDYQHLLFGKADVIGGGAGGEYVEATWWQNAGPDFIYWDDTSHNGVFDGYSDTELIAGMIRHDGAPTPWKPFGQPSGDPRQYVSGTLRTEGMFYPLDRNSPRATFRRTFAVPIIVHTNEALLSTSPRWSPTFKVKDVLGVSLESFVPGETFNDGTDDWQIFPLQRKGETNSLNQDTTYASSGHVGVAYKVI